jgi:hypothetical protein
VDNTLGIGASEAQAQKAIMCGVWGDADDDPQYVTCPPSSSPSFPVSSSPTEFGYTPSPTISSITIVTASASMVMSGFGESQS